MYTKICGITNSVDAQTAIRAGASALGFLVGITHRAEDKISANEAKSIIAGVPPFVSSVLVTHLVDADEIISLAKELGVSTVQIHDYVEPQIVSQIRSSLAGIKIIKALPVREQAEALMMAAAFQDSCDALLLDSISKDRIGGTGITHDWTISRSIVAASSVPVILAGGLTPDNVQEAVACVRPFAVDVNSGVEIDGRKDFEKVSKFIKNAQLSQGE